jgi:8-amino-7-oxononanoate synthase
VDRDGSGARREAGANGGPDRRGDGLWESGLRELSREGLRRELPSVAYNRGGAAGSGRPLVLCSNDYLALAGDPRVKGAAMRAVEECGVGSTGSRLLSGNSKYHMQLEADLARFTGRDACLIFGSGYHANVGSIPVLSSGMRAIYSDELNHASIVDGCRLARAKTVRYRHCDPSHLDELLSKEEWGGAGGALVITEGVFSMDGDVAPLGELAEVARAHGALLMLDDAHGFGVLGEGARGTAQAAGAEDGVDVYLATMGKALGSMGGLIAGSRALISLLTSAARAMMYSTALPPAACAAASAALSVVKSEPHRRESLSALGDLLRAELESAGLDTGASETHIVPVMVRGAGAAVELAGRLEKRGYLARAIRYPTVARGAERIRVSLRCDITGDQVRGLAAAASEEARAFGLTG